MTPESNDAFRIFVTSKDIDDNVGKLRGVNVRFLNDKDFLQKVKSGEISVKNKVILFVEKSYSTFKKLIDDNYIKIDIRGVDKQKFIKLDYSTSLQDNSKYLILDPFNELDKNKKINSLISLDYNSENNNSIIPYKLINKKYFVDNYDEIINSLVGDIGFDYETHGIDMMKTDSNFEIIGVGFCDMTHGYYIEFRNDNSVDETVFKEKYKQFIKDNYKRLWAYYCPFEIMVNYWYLGEFIELQDSMVLCIADENSGSLKYASQYYLKSIDWESETSAVKEAYIRDIYNSLSDEEKDKIYSILGDLSKRHLDILLKDENIGDKFVPTEYDFYAGEYESYKEKYITSNGSTISYLPSKVVSKYCIYDCYNTLRLKNMLYDQYRKAYDCFIKNIYLSIPLQNHGLLLDHEKLNAVSDKYQHILYNLEILIAKFYYNYSINNLSFEVNDLISNDAIVFFKSYGIESTLSISKKIANDCINKDIVGYLDYTSLYDNILNEELRTKIISLLETYKHNESLLKNITASTKIVKEINYILNNYDDSQINQVVIDHFNKFIKDFESLKPSHKVELTGNYPQFSGSLYNAYITSNVKTIIDSQLENVNYDGMTGKELTVITKSIIKDIKSLVKDYRDNHDNILTKLDASIKKKTIEKSKNEFINLLETYFKFELVVKYKIGDNFYDKKTRERYFKLLTQLEVNDYILVNSCNNQQELDELDDLTEDQKFKYGKIKFKQLFLDEYENVYNKANEFYEQHIVKLLKDYYKLEDIIDKLIGDNLLDKNLFMKSISKEFNFIDYTKAQFDLTKLIKYHTDKDTLNILNSIEVLDILENDTGIRHDIGINLVSPINKKMLSDCIMDNYKNIIYNFHKIYKTGKFDLTKYDSYAQAVDFLESVPSVDEVDVNTYIKKTFSLLPQMRTLKYYYNDSLVEKIDTSFINNNKSFEECAKIMYCLNLYYKLDKVYGSYINGNIIAKNTNMFDYIDDQGFTYTKEDSNFKITQSRFKMLSLKTKRSSAGIHTLNKNLEPSKYLKVYKDHIGIYFDLSAAEVRAAAYMSGDEVLIKLFKDGVDIYNWMRESLSKLIDRNGYKAIVLGLIYGRSSDSIAKSLGHLNPEIVIDGIEMFKNKFHKLWKFIESQTEYCIERGKINTVLGDLIDVSSYHRSKKSTVGMNYSVQGFTAALVAEGGYNIYKSLYDQGLYVRLINLVHDSLSYSSHARNFFDVYNKLQELFVDYLYEKYGYLFKFDLDLFLNMSDKTSIKKSNDDEDVYELSGDHAIEIFDKLNKYNNLELISKEVIEDNRHIYQVIDNDKYIKVPQDLYIDNDHIMYNKSKVMFKFIR